MICYSSTQLWSKIHQSMGFLILFTGVINSITSACVASFKHSALLFKCSDIQLILNKMATLAFINFANHANYETHLTKVWLTVHFLSSHNNDEWNQHISEKCPISQLLLQISVWLFFNDRQSFEIFQKYCSLDRMSFCHKLIMV